MPAADITHQKPLWGRRHFMVARFQSPLLFAWSYVSKQGDVAKKLELAEAVGFFFFFQNCTNVTLLSMWYILNGYFEFSAYFYILLVPYLIGLYLAPGCFFFVKNTGEWAGAGALAALGGSGGAWVLARGALIQKHTFEVRIHGKLRWLAYSTHIFLERI